MPTNTIVLDLETQKSFDEVGGKNYLAELKISVAGIYRYSQNAFECYFENELHLLENLLIDCDLLIGFNHRKFDMPVLQAYTKLDTSKLPMLDLMEDIHLKIGHRVGLDSIAQATLNIGKTGHGLDALEYFRKGELEKLKSYCLNDVKITKEVYEFGCQNGYVSYLSRDGSVKKRVEVEWADWQNQRGAVDAVKQYNLSF